MMICYKFYISFGLIYNFMNPVNFSNILQNKINAMGYATIVSNWGYLFSMIHPALLHTAALGVTT
jgi:hypothetical protein